MPTDEPSHPEPDELGADHDVDPELLEVFEVEEFLRQTGQQGITGVQRDPQ